MRPALDFAQAVFEKYVLPDFEPPASGRQQNHLDSEDRIHMYLAGRQKMFVAWDGLRIIGMMCEREGSHILKLYVDSEYHHKGLGRNPCGNECNPYYSERIALWLAFLS